MAIRLSGLPFDIAVISELEKNLTQKGFLLGDFAFEKNRRPKPYSAAYAMGVEYEYTISVSGKKFSISFSDDVQFAHFFYNLCCSEDEKYHSAEGRLLDAIIRKVERCAEVTKHWLMGEPLKDHSPDTKS